MACQRRKHLIRPPIDDLRRQAARVVEGRVQRLTPAGLWVPDDGVSPGRAFTAGVVAYYPGPQCDCCHSDRALERCIMEKAMRHVGAHYAYGCANGREIRRYIKRGGEHLKGGG